MIPGVCEFEKHTLKIHFTTTTVQLRLYKTRDYFLKKLKIVKIPFLEEDTIPMELGSFSNDNGDGSRNVTIEFAFFQTSLRLFQLVTIIPNVGDISCS